MPALPLVASRMTRPGASALARVLPPPPTPPERAGHSPDTRLPLLGGSQRRRAGAARSSARRLRAPGARPLRPLRSVSHARDRIENQGERCHVRNIRADIPRQPLAWRGRPRLACGARGRSICGRAPSMKCEWMQRPPASSDALNTMKFVLRATHACARYQAVLAVSHGVDAINFRFCKIQRFSRLWFTPLLLLL